MTVFNKKFQVSTRNLTIGLNINQDDFIVANRAIERFFEFIYEYVARLAAEQDKISFFVNHHSLETPIIIPFVRKTVFSPDLISNYFLRVCQSKKTLRIDNTLVVKSQIAAIPTGQGFELDKVLKSKRSTFCIQNTDGRCGLRAFIVGMFISEKRKGIHDMLKRKRNKEIENIISGVPIDFSRGCSISVMREIEQHFKHYQLVLYDISCTYSKSFFYCGDPNLKHIYLLLYNNHYYTIKSPKSFFNTKHFCHYCKTPFNHIANHKCKYICFMCKRTECDYESKVQCTKCLKFCLNSACLQNHVNICSFKSFCENCQQNYYNYFHVCKADCRWCDNCKTSADHSHRCFIKSDCLPLNKYVGYIFYDFEAAHSKSNVHVPNLVVAYKYNLDKTIIERKYFYDKGKDVNQAFCSWLFSEPYYIAIAHNFKGYDSAFIMNYLLTNLLPNKPMPKIINTGTKIIGVEWKNVRCLDSYCFLPMALSEFSKTFGLDEVKGYFPHFFNTESNQSIIGEPGWLPERHFYGDKYMSSQKKKKFDMWYDSQKKSNKVFNFKDEFIAYCENDVKLLADGCFKFRDIIYSLAEIEPFFNNYTIASLTHSIYRLKFMPFESIGVIPENGYNPHEQSSRKAAQWIGWIEESRGIKIPYHAYSRLGEMRIGPYKLDGFINQENAFEFHGCLYHGHPKCYSPDTFNPFTKEKMKDTYARHIKRISYLKDHVRLEQIWECEWDELCLTDLKLKHFLSCFHVKLPLNPRHAMMGGRTNAARLYYKIKGGEMIFHYDICSLYPWVQKYCKFPMGHPVIITSDFENLDTYFGIIKCLITPPARLLFPVLPVRSNGKLVFGLCFKCIQTQNNNPCKHDSKTRALEGTWCLPEIQKAVELGYKVLKVYEIWHWPKTSLFSAKDKTSGLFSEYVNCFLKIKMEASGWPEWVVSEQDQENFIESFHKQEGVLLDKNKISYNEGLRKVSKLMLNSHWGRYGMNTNRSKIKIISSLSDWYNIIDNDDFVVHDVVASTNEILQVSISDNASLHCGSFHNNVSLAAFVTCYARLKLFQSLSVLGNRVLYYDTDSIIFIVDQEFLKSEKMIKAGDHLGDWTNEIKSDNGEAVYITEFGSAGPKNYIKKYSNGKCENVVKGFCFTSAAAEKLNYESIKTLILSNLARKPKYSISVVQSSIKRNKKTWEMNSAVCDKEYNMVYDKRVINYSDFTTLPFGTI